MRNYSAFYHSTLISNSPTFVANDNESVWSDCIFEIVDCYKMKLVVINFTIDSCYCFHRSKFHRFDQFLRQFILLLNCTFGSLALQSKLAIIFTDLTFIGLICPWDNSLMNCILGSTIYSSLDAVITAKLFSLKSKYIYHFMIVHYQKRLSSNRRSMEKLWDWYSKSRFNYI